MENLANITISQYGKTPADIDRIQVHMTVRFSISTWKVPSPSLIQFAQACWLMLGKESIRGQGEVLYLANKPLSATGISEDNAYGWKIVQKMNS